MKLSIHTIPKELRFLIIKTMSKKLFYVINGLKIGTFQIFFLRLVNKKKLEGAKSAL